MQRIKKSKLKEVFSPASKDEDESIYIEGNMFLKRLSFGSKEFTKELKLERANFLGQTS